MANCVAGCTLPLKENFFPVNMILLKLKVFIDNVSIELLIQSTCILLPKAYELITFWVLKKIRSKGKFLGIESQFLNIPKISGYFISYGFTYCRIHVAKNALHLKKLFYLKRSPTAIKPNSSSSWSSYSIEILYVF